MKQKGRVSLDSLTHSQRFRKYSVPHLIDVVQFLLSKQDYEELEGKDVREKVRILKREWEKEILERELKKFIKFHNSHCNFSEDEITQTQIQNYLKQWNP